MGVGELRQEERASRRTPASQRLVLWLLPSGLLQGRAGGHRRARTDRKGTEKEESTTVDSANQRLLLSPCLLSAGSFRSTSAWIPALLRGHD